MITSNVTTESAALTAAQKASARAELGRFFQLPDPVDTEQYKMFSGAIDAVWHDLLADREAYDRFLAEASIPERFGHEPGEGFGVIQWVNEYHEQFGRLDAIWFTDAKGQLDRATYDTYLTTKTVVVAWNCGVIKPTMD